MENRLSPTSFRVLKFLFSYDWEIVEIQGSLFKMLWGFWLLMPFRVFRSISGYNAVGTENYWGWGLFLLGLIHLGMILSQNLRLRQIFAMISVFFWSFTVFLVWQQSRISVLLPLFSLIGFFMFVNFLRLSVALDSERRKRNLGLPTGTERRSENE